MPPATKKLKTTANGKSTAKAPPAAATSSKTKQNGASSASASNAAPAKAKPSSPAAQRHSKAANISNKRKANDHGSGNEDEGHEATKAPMLKSRVRTIPRSTVNARWNKLDEGSQEEVMQLIKNAERPIIMQIRKDKRRVEAQATTAKLITKLSTLIKKIPVPTAPKDCRLDFEKLVTKNSELESMLEPYTHQIAELEAEISRETQLCEADEAQLKQLKLNAKAEEKVRAEQAKNIPRVLRFDRQDNGNAMTDDMNLVEPSSSNSMASSSYRVDLDRQLKPLTVQLQQHLTSMQSNCGALGEVTEWIQRSKAAVDEVLVGNEDAELYAATFGI